MSGSVFKTRYRVNRDWFWTRWWAVEQWRWYWPFWVEVRGLLHTKEEALELIQLLSERRS